MWHSAYKTFIIMTLSISIKLSVIMISVAILNVVILSVVAPKDQWLSLELGFKLII